MNQKQGQVDFGHNAPTTLAQLFVFLLKDFIKNIPKRIVLALIFGFLVFIIHTYLLVFINDGFYITSENSLLNSILLLNGSESGSSLSDTIRIITVLLFWMLLPIVFFGSYAQIRAYGAKTFFKKISYSLVQLFSEIFEKPGTILLSLFLGSVVFGLIGGIITSNPLFNLLLALALFLAASARGGSLLILISYLFWSDLQRLLKINPRRPFYIDIVCMVLRGLALGFLLGGSSQLAPNGKILQYVVLAVIAGLLVLNILKRKPSKLGSFPFFFTSALLCISAKVFAHDGGWTESGRSLLGWMNNEGFSESLKRGLLAGLSTAIGFIPIVGDIKDLQEAILGVDLITGEKLSPWERILTGTTAIVPIINGKVLRTGVKTATDAMKHADEVGDVISASERFRNLRKSVRFLKNSDVDKFHRRRIISAFGDDLHVERYTNDIPAVRYYNKGENPRGKWLTPERVDNPQEVLALPPTNRADAISEWIIKRDTEVLVGTAAPQPQWGRSGGGTQIFLPNPDALEMR